MQAHHPKWQYRAVRGTAVAVGLAVFVIACSDHELPTTAPMLTPVNTTASASANSAQPLTLEKAKSKTSQDSVPGSISPPPVMRSVSAGSMDLKAVRNMLEEWTRRRSGTRFKVDFSLTLRVLDAMEARTPEERRRILAELPIKLEKQSLEPMRLVGRSYALG